MTIEPKDGNVVLEAVRTAVEHYGASQDELIPILNDVNRAIGDRKSTRLNSSH